MLVEEKHLAIDAISGGEKGGEMVRQRGAGGSIPHVRGSSKRIHQPRWDSRLERDTVTALNGVINVRQKPLSVRDSHEISHVEATYVSRFFV